MISSPPEDNIISTQISPSKFQLRYIPIGKWRFQFWKDDLPNSNAPTEDYPLFYLTSTKTQILWSKKFLSSMFMTKQFLLLCSMQNRFIELEKSIWYQRVIALTQFANFSMDKCQEKTPFVIICSIASENLFCLVIPSKKSHIMKPQMEKISWKTNKMFAVNKNRQHYNHQP